MATITLNVNGEAVQEPTTPVTEPLNIETQAGAINAQMNLPEITNDGNIVKTLKLTITNLSNCTVARVGKTVGNNTNFMNDSTTIQHPLQPNHSMIGIVQFNVTPPAVGQPATQASAEYTYEWL